MRVKEKGLNFRRILWIFGSVLALVLFSGSGMMKIAAFAPSVSNASFSSPIALISIAKSSPPQTYTIELFRYSDSISGSNPNIVSAQNITSGSGVLYLYDAGLASLQNANPFVHYSILVIQPLTDTQIGYFYSYDWSIVVQNGQYETNEFSLAPSLSIATVSRMNASSLYPPKASVSSPLYPCCYGIWEGIDSYEAYTTVGESHAIGGMINQFTYGQYSSSEVSVELGASGQGWSVSGSIAVENGQGQSQQWPDLTGYGGFDDNTQFSYVEQQFYYCTYGHCSAQNQFKTFPTVFIGGDQTWCPGGTNCIKSPNQNDYACVSQVKNGDEGYWAHESPGSTFTEANTNGEKYTLAASVSGLPGDGTYVSFSLTTQYNTNAMTVMKDFQTPQQNPTYGANDWYLYSGAGNYNWNVIYVTNSNHDC